MTQLRGLALAAVLFASPAFAQDKAVEWRFAHWVPPSHPFAKRRQVSMEDVAPELIVAHNEEELHVLEALHRKGLENDVEGLEHREIAEILGIAEGTSKSQVHKARMRLRAMLGR